MDAFRVNDPVPGPNIEVEVDGVDKRTGGIDQNARRAREGFSPAVDVLQRDIPTTAVVFSIDDFDVVGRRSSNVGYLRPPRPVYHWER